MDNVKISIIIRAKNEERWITPCLRAVSQQTVQDFEIILVDNCSTDKTVEKAKPFNVQPLTITDYRPGKALNLGMRASRGEFLVSLSAHCIPRDPRWLEMLLKNFADPWVAGVYGRQEPMAQTSPQDKRDLLITFGLDRRVQIKDSFFHNANSMIRRSVWEEIPFDEDLANIEDRAWAQLVVASGYKVVYEPEASVYHYHGIHQNGNEERCLNVARVMESLDLLPRKNEGFLRDLKIVAMIPVKGADETLCGKPLMAYAIERARESRFIDSVIVSTDNQEAACLAQRLGAEVPFIRPAWLSADEVGIEAVFQYTLEQLEIRGVLPDLLVTLNVRFPFRPPGLLDNLIQLHCEKGLDSVFPGFPTYRSCWIETGNGLKRVDQGFQPRQIKQPIHVGYIGLGCVTFPSFVRQGRLLGDKVGILEVLDSYSTFEIKDAVNLDIATKLFPEWWKANQRSVVSKECDRVGNGREALPDNSWTE